MYSINAVTSWSNVFVTSSIIYKGGQAIKPIIVMKMSCELIQVKGFSMKNFTFLASILSGADPGGGLWGLETPSRNISGKLKE